MSSIWTPGGEHEVGRSEAPQRPTAPPQGSPGPARSGRDPGRPDPGDGPGDGPDGPEELTDEQLEQMQAMQEQMLATPATAVVTNQCLALYELAALYLSPDPPKLEDARLAIDAIAALMGAIGDRLGPNEGPLRDALSQLQMAFVEAKKSSG